MLHSSVDIALTRDYLDETKAGDKADICFIVQLIEHSPETVLIGERRQVRHLIYSSVDRAFTRDIVDWRKETSQTFDL